MSMKAQWKALDDLLRSQSIPISLRERGMSEALEEFEQTEDGEEKKTMEKTFR